MAAATRADDHWVMIAFLDLGTWVLLLASLTFFASTVVLTMAWKSRQDSTREQELGQASDDQAWRRLARNVLGEAKEIVDLTTPAGVESLQPSTSTLGTVTRRIDRLDQQLHRLTSLPGFRADPSSSRLAEATMDIRRVGTSLGSAIEAERSLRVGSTDRPSDEREQSARRIVERSVELDLAADEFEWLIESDL